MSEICLRRAHGLNHAKARAAAERVARELEKEFDLAWKWEPGDPDRLRFSRSGVTGFLHVGAHDLEIRVRLGFLLLPLRARVEQEIHRYCDEQFGKSTRSVV